VSAYIRGFDLSAPVHTYAIGSRLRVLLFASMQCSLKSLLAVGGTGVLEFKRVVCDEARGHIADSNINHIGDVSMVKCTLQVPVPTVTSGKMGRFCPVFLKGTGCVVRASLNVLNRSLW
jgi:hypothetical protein